ncbi:hypothetical protein KC845_01785 [Candidatus Kaiserbacteria bacterium]|nr:hypothetical protein [Candidatus Kaiserbacteria bacterium]
MEHITLGEKTFVKANIIAQELGYTSDYIGQLCRAKKVEAKLVGRSWYVNEDSIRDHKKSRYRSVKTVVKKALHKEVGRQVKLNESLSQTSDKTANFYKHKSSTIFTPRYHSDDSDLIPVLIKKTSAEIDKDKPSVNHRIPVGLAEAENIKIKNKEKVTTFEASPLPEVRFKGNLNIKSADDEIDDEEVAVDESLSSADSTPEVDNTIEVSLVDPVDEGAVPVAIHHKPLTKPTGPSKKIKRSKSRSGTRALEVVDDDHSIDNPVPIEVAEEEVISGHSWSIRLLIILLTTLVAGAFAALLLMTQFSITVDSATITTEYKLNTGQLMYIIALF